MTRFSKSILRTENETVVLNFISVTSFHVIFDKVLNLICPCTSCVATHHLTHSSAFYYVNVNRYEPFQTIFIFFDLINIKVDSKYIFQIISILNIAQGYRRSVGIIHLRERIRENSTFSINHKKSLLVIEK